MMGAPFCDGITQRCFKCTGMVHILLQFHMKRPAERVLDCTTFARTQVGKMIDTKVFEDFAQKVSGLIASSPAADIEKNVRSMMGSFFSKLDLVTREEFDTQANVLARTRQLVDQLTARLDEIEAQNKNRP